MNSHQQDGIRKAAVLALSLDRASADALLEQLSPEQAQSVRQVMVDLDQIDPHEQRRVVDEFLRLGPPKAPSHNNTQGVELTGELARRIAESSDRSEISSPVLTNTAPTSSKPFRVLQETEVDRLARALGDERPQTVALVLSHFPPEQAGGVLVRLPDVVQVEVIRRLVDLEETDPAILHEVEQALVTRLSRQVYMQRRRVAGVEAVSGILKASGGSVSLQILDNLASHDRALADRLGPPPIEFEDLTKLDDAAMEILFREAGRETVLAALFGAPHALIERIVRRFPASEAETIRRKIDHPGPIQLRDVERAQQRIAELARRLAIEGRIKLPQERLTAVA